MMKRFFAPAALALAALATPQAAVAQDSYIVYITIYYSDASRTTQVGTLTGDCGRYGPQYTLSGQQSPYSEEFESFRCENGYPQPL